MKRVSEQHWVEATMTGTVHGCDKDTAFILPKLYVS